MQTEFVDALSSYLLGWLSIADCAEKAASFDWDDPALDEETRDALGRIQLLVTEVSEGMRPEIELKQAAAEIVGKTGRIIFVAADTTPPLATVPSANNDVVGQTDIPPSVSQEESVSSNKSLQWAPA